MRWVVYLLALQLFLTLTLGSFVYSLANTSFYDHQFSRLGSDPELGLNVVDYVNGRGVLSDAFNERESAHLADVRSLFTVVKAIYYTSLLALFVLIGYTLIKHRFYSTVPQALFVGGVSALATLAVLFLFSLSFSTFFNTIHLPFFGAGSYVFPEDSILIQTFPEEFFRAFTFNLFRFIFINAGVFFLIGVYTRKKYKFHAYEERQHTKKL